MTIGQSTVQTELYRTTKYDGLPLADLTRFEYSTFARSASGTGDLRQPTYLRLNVDSDDDGDRDDSLLFIPANNGVVRNGEWQHWDVDSGKLSVNGDTGAADTISLSDYAAEHPEATLYNNGADWDGDPAEFGAVALVTGGNGLGNADPQTKGEYFVDRVVIGADDVDTLFDFGPNAQQAGAVTELTVDPTNLQGWHHQAYNNEVYLNSVQSFVDGPATPPAGGGSLRFALSDDTDSDRVELFRTTRFDGTLVRDLRTLEFSTFQRATGGNTTAQQPVYLRLSVDNDGNGKTDNTLFYYPGNNGAVAQSAWQGWDATEGVWGVDGDPGPADSITLEQYAVAHPDAKIVKNADGNNPAGGLAFLVGGAGAATQMNGEYFLDDITVGMVDAATGHTTSATGFDLEPVAPGGLDRQRARPRGQPRCRAELPRDPQRHRGPLGVRRLRDGRRHGGGRQRLQGGHRHAHDPGGRDHRGHRGQGPLGQAPRGQGADVREHLLAGLRHCCRRDRPRHDRQRRHPGRAPARATPPRTASASRWTPCPPRRGRPSRSSASSRVTRPAC